MKEVLRNAELVREELDTCLFSVTGSVLRHAGWNDRLSLGASLDFCFSLKGAERTEYYLPVREGALLEALLPGQGATSSWHSPNDPEAAWWDLRRTIIAGHPAVVAVDNYFLPFRPAFQDVHSNHLLMVYGFDDEEDLVYVLDATPPRFRGVIKADDLRRARGSATPAEHDRDMFFARSPIGNRQLRVCLPTVPWTPDVAELWRVVELNLSSLLGNSPDPDWLIGLPGMRHLATLAEEAPQQYCEDIFIVSGSVLARRARHSGFLAEMSVRTGEPALAEIAGQMQEAAYQWAAIRILASREAKERPETVGSRLARSLRSVADLEEAAAEGLSVVLP